MRPSAVARRLLLALAVVCLAGGAPLSGADTSGRIEAPPRAGLELRGVALVTSKADANVGAPLAFAFDYLVPEKDKDRGLTFGAVVERRGENDAWVEIPPEDLAIEIQRFPPRGETERSGTRMVVTPRTGLPAGSYRVQVSALLPDESEAAAINKTIAWQVLPREAAAKSGGDVPPVIYDKTFPVRFESWEAASDTVGGRFPGGQNLAFHGAWTDPVTGMVYLRNRWYDPRNGQFLSPDPRGPVDSPNLYAFVGQQPSMGTDPMGTCVGSLQRSGFCQGIAEGLRSFGQGTPAAESEANERELYLRQKLAFMQANGRRPDADEVIFSEGGGARLLYGSGKWVDASGRIEADHAEWAAIGVGLAGRAAYSVTRAAGGSVLRATGSAAVAAADETAGNIVGVNPGTVTNAVGAFRRGLTGRPALSGDAYASGSVWQRQIGFQNQYVDWADTAGQRLGRSADSDVLAGNLDALGVARPSNAAAHHLVAGTDSRAGLARSILVREGIDINEAANGVFLPQSRRVQQAPVMTHSTIHTDAYYLELTRRLAGAAPGTVRETLRSVADDIADGNFPR